MDIIIFEKDTYWKMQKDLMDMFALALKQAQVPEFDWISPERAKLTLDIKSDSMMQKLRDNDSIKYSKHGPKNIVYSLKSINEYLLSKMPKY